MGLMSPVGTFETIQDVRSLVAKGGKADNICSMRGLLSLTHCGSRAGNLAVMHNGSSNYMLGLET